MRKQRVGGKYEPLRRFLESQSEPRVTLTFEQVKKILRVPLPASAYTHTAWWGNSPERHYQAHAWLDAGWHAKALDIAGQKLTFERKHG